uniref:Wsv131-like protein n=1 Tax=Trachysalambria curvirostris majanivirus TaxID=2984281 RepID=A0A9C7F887_9VIRU|nr:MAG: wsv131-like protein [Trachysalambria curvirostris majanivirus]
MENNIDNTNYISFLDKNKHTKQEINDFSDIHFNNISTLNSTINKIESYTERGRLKYDISNPQDIISIENIISKNNKRVSSLPTLYNKMLQHMSKEDIHLIKLTKVSPGLENASFLNTNIDNYNKSNSFHKNDEKKEKLILDLSKHTSQISAKEMYKDKLDEVDYFKEMYKDKLDEVDYFSFGFSPETELLKNLIVAVNVISSLFISSFIILENDIDRRKEIICNKGNEYEYAKLLKDVRNLNSLSKAILNYIDNSHKFLLPLGKKQCSCCGSKTHKQSPLIDKFNKEHDGVNSYNTTKKYDDILIPPELSFRGITGIPSRATYGYSLQTKMKKSESRINSTVRNKIKGIMNNIKNNKYTLLDKNIKYINNINDNPTLKAIEYNKDIENDIIKDNDQSQLKNISQVSTPFNINTNIIKNIDNNPYTGNGNESVLNNTEPIITLYSPTVSSNDIKNDAEYNKYEKSFKNDNYINMRNIQQRKEIIGYLKD